MERRSLLKVAVGAIAAAVGTVVGGPIALLLGHPLRSPTGARVKGEWVRVAALADLAEGRPLRANAVAPVVIDAWVRRERVSLGALWLVRRGDRVEALSANCPHAGCFVDYEVSAARFACPCHASTFDGSGQRLAGPAPRAMDRLETRVENDTVLVRFERFRPGRAEKEPIS